MAHPEKNASLHPAQTAVTVAPGAPELPATPTRFVLFFLKFYKWFLLAIVLFEAGQAASSILMPYAIKNIIDAVTLSEGSGHEAVFAALKTPVMLFVVLNIGVLLFSRASGSLLVIVGPLLRKKVRGMLYHYLQNHSQRYFMGNFAGSLANRVAEVSMSVNHALWTVVFDFWPVTIIFTVSLTLLYGAHPSLALWLLGWIVVYIGISYMLALRCRGLSKDFAAARSVVSGRIVDAVTNIVNTKMFAHMAYERKNLEGYLDHEVKMARRTYWFMEIMRWFQFTGALILMILMLWRALDVWLLGEITVGEFAMVMSLSLMIIESARGLSRRFLEFFEYIGNITDGVHIIVQPHEVVDVPDAKPLVVTAGEIRFKDVDFSYADGKAVFHNMNITIHAGEKVGLVGFSGSGKSTFVNLILRFFEVSKGAVLIDGQDVKAHSQESVRRQIAMIPQDPILFHRSLLENIRYGKLDAGVDDVVDAAQKARAHDFIQDIPEKYDAMVGERGIKLSGGQRQRIAIARAIVKDAPILLMDEATSSLDSVTEKDIQDALDTVMQGRTVIVIAHRLSTIANLDRILVFNEGEIVEDGSHDVLLQKKGFYHTLWQMQAGGFLPETPISSLQEEAEE